MIKSIIFDLGGVLFTNGTNDFVKFLAEKYNLDQDKVGFAVSDSDYGNEYRKGKLKREDFYKILQENLGISEHIDVLEDEWIKRYKLIEATKDIILDLAKKYKVYFLSDSVKERVDRLNNEHQFIKWFEDGIFSFDQGIRKPHLELYKIMIEKVKTKPEETVFIDDKEKNLVPARDLGIIGILFENPQQLREELKKLKIL